MNALNLRSWSERHQVIAVILMAGVIIFTLCLFMLVPLNRGRRQLEKEIDSMQRQLASKNYLLGEDVLRKRKTAAEDQNRKLNEEWTAVTARVGTFDAAENLSGTDVRKIDFKVELFDVRHRLLKKSRELRVALPHDFGMDEEVHSNVDARKLMLQLRTVEKLVDLTLDLKIGMLRTILPRTPVRYAAGVDNDVFMEEYPVEVEFFATHESLYDLFRSTLDAEHVFALRNLQVESAAKGKPGFLSIRATMSAFVFLKGPQELKLAPAGEITKSGPMGH